MMLGCAGGCGIEVNYPGRGTKKIYCIECNRLSREL